MKLNLFIKIDNEVIPAEHITKEHKYYDDWYYMSGAIELINSDGIVMLNKENEIDVIPVFREFLLTIHQYKQIFDLYFDEWEMREKLCAKTGLYYPHTPTMIFSHMNDVFMELSLSASHEEFMNTSLVEEIPTFYQKLKRATDNFAKALEFMFGDDANLKSFLPMQKWMDNIMKQIE